MYCLAVEKLFHSNDNNSALFKLSTRTDKLDKQIAMSFNNLLKNIKLIIKSVT